MAEMGTLPNGNAMASESKIDSELKELWQEYLQKCCETGQIEFQLHQLDQQRLDIEKELDKTKRQVRTVAQKHRDLQKKVLQAEQQQQLRDPKIEVLQ